MSNHHPHDLLVAELDAFRVKANQLIDASDNALHEGAPGAYVTYFHRFSRALLELRLATDAPPRRSTGMTTTHG